MIFGAIHILIEEVADEILEQSSRQTSVNQGDQPIARYDMRGATKFIKALIAAKTPKIKRK